MIEKLEMSSQDQVTIDNITEFEDINLLNELSDLILAKNEKLDKLWVLRNYKDDSIYSNEVSIYYTTANNLSEAKYKFEKYLTNLSTITPVKTISLPLIPKFV